HDPDCAITRRPAESYGRKPFPDGSETKAASRVRVPTKLTRLHYQSRSRTSQRDRDCAITRKLAASFGRRSFPDGFETKVASRVRVPTKFTRHNYQNPSLIRQHDPDCAITRRRAASYGRRPFPDGSETKAASRVRVPTKLTRLHYQSRSRTSQRDRD